MLLDSLPLTSYFIPHTSFTPLTPYAHAHIPSPTHQCLRWDEDNAHFEVLDGKLFEGRFNLLRYVCCSRRTQVLVPG